MSSLVGSARRRTRGPAGAPFRKKSRVSQPVHLTHLPPPGPGEIRRGPQRHDRHLRARENCAGSEEVARAVHEPFCRWWPRAICEWGLCGGERLGNHLVRARDLRGDHVAKAVGDDEDSARSGRIVCQCGRQCAVAKPSKNSTRVTRTTPGPCLVASPGPWPMQVHGLVFMVQF